MWLDLKDQQESHSLVLVPSVNFSCSATACFGILPKLLLLLFLFHASNNQPTIGPTNHSTNHPINRLLKWKGRTSYELWFCLVSYVVLGTTGDSFAHPCSNAVQR
jgi:hypothetical protein